VGIEAGKRIWPWGKRRAQFRFVSDNRRLRTSPKHRGNDGHSGEPKNVQTMAGNASATADGRHGTQSPDRGEIPISNCGSTVAGLEQRTRTLNFLFTVAFLLHPGCRRDSRMQSSKLV